MEQEQRLTQVTLCANLIHGKHHFGGVIVQEHVYKWDKWWSMEYGRGMGTMWNFCSRKTANVVECKYV